MISKRQLKGFILNKDIVQSFYIKIFDFNIRIKTLNTHKNLFVLQKIL